MKRLLSTTAMTVGGFALLTGTAFAHDCYNSNKKPLAGAQIVFSDTGVTMTKGLEKRVEKGLVDPESEEGFHGTTSFEICFANCVAEKLAGSTARHRPGRGDARPGRWSQRTDAPEVPQPDVPNRSEVRHS